jgi:hypothetical protein
MAIAAHMFPTQSAANNVSATRFILLKHLLIIVCFICDLFRFWFYTSRLRVYPLNNECLLNSPQKKVHTKNQQNKGNTLRAKYA